MPQFLEVVFVLFFFEQCPRTVKEHCSSNSCIVQYDVPQDSLVLSRTQDVCTRSQHRPNNPALSLHQKTMLRRRKSQPYRDRENFVAIDFSFTLKCRCHDKKIMSRHETNPRRRITVATPKPQLPKTLSRHETNPRRRITVATPKPQLPKTLSQHETNPQRTITVAT